MQKILPIILALAIIIPAFAAEAADVPDFRAVAGRQVKFTNSIKWSNPTANTRFYKYRWSVDLDENFVEQYVILIQKTGLFTLIAHDVVNYKDGSEDTDKWVFVYKGPKRKVPTFETFNKDPYKAHLTIDKRQKYKKGVVELTIRVAARLTYGGDE